MCDASRRSKLCAVVGLAVWTSAHADLKEGCLAEGGGKGRTAVGVGESLKEGCLAEGGEKMGRMAVGVGKSLKDDAIVFGDEQAGKEKKRLADVYLVSSVCYTVFMYSKTCNVFMYKNNDHLPLDRISLIVVI